MSEKVRGALFNALGDIGGLTVLDAFAGSGALSFEAISRGAESVVAIDSDRNAQHAIDGNITTLGLAKRVRLIKASASAWLSTTDQLFDIVLCDPPYDDLKLQLLGELADRSRAGGLAVFSVPPTVNLNLPEDFREVSRKDYGDSPLRFFRRS